MFSKCGLLTHAQNLVYRQTAAFTARGFLGPVVTELWVGNRLRPRERSSSQTQPGVDGQGCGDRDGPGQGCVSLFSGEGSLFGGMGFAN